MTNTDKELFRILNEKLNGLESPVSADVWNSVQQQMNAAGHVAAAKTGFWTTKLIVGLAGAAMIAGVVLVSVQKNDQPEQVQTTQQSGSSTPQSATGSEESKVDSSAMSLAPPTPEMGTVTYTEIVSSSCDFVPPLEEHVDNAQYLGMDDVIVANGGNMVESLSNNDSVEGNEENNLSMNAEPLSAGFHARCVDSEDLRYFFFPKTDKAQSFKWVVSDGTESNEMSFAHVFEKEGHYTITLTVKGIDGQITTESESIPVFKPILFKIPTAITPGNSGKNDVIDFAEAIENEKALEYLVIRDKQGNVVYESKNAFVWNGNNTRQEVCPAGVYTYVVIAIDKENKSQTNKGTIQLFHE